MTDIPMVAETAAIAYIQRMIVDAKIANRDMLTRHSKAEHWKDTLIADWIKNYWQT